MKPITKVVTAILCAPLIWVLITYTHSEGKDILDMWTHSYTDRYYEIETTHISYDTWKFSCEELGEMVVARHPSR